jgi:hypothetical protein
MVQECPMMAEMTVVGTTVTVALVLVSRLMDTVPT